MGAAPPPRRIAATPSTPPAARRHSGVRGKRGWVAAPAVACPAPATPAAPPPPTPPDSTPATPAPPAPASPPAPRRTAPPTARYAPPRRRGPRTSRPLYRMTEVRDLEAADVLGAFQAEVDARARPVGHGLPVVAGNVGRRVSRRVDQRIEPAAVDHVHRPQVARAVPLARHRPDGHTANGGGLACERGAGTAKAGVKAAGTACAQGHGESRGCARSSGCRREVQRRASP